MGAGHDFIILDYGAKIIAGPWEFTADCDARSCKNWLTCAVSKSCQRGPGRPITVPTVETRIHLETGNIALRCHDYADKPTSASDTSSASTSGEVDNEGCVGRGGM